MSENIRQSERWLRPLSSSGGSSSGVAGGTYNSSATTLTSGATVGFQVDAAGNEKIVEQFAPLYEDNVAGVAKVEQRGGKTLLTSATTLLSNATSGFFYSFNVGMPSCPTIAFYDSLLPGVNLIQRISAGYPLGSHVMNISFATGLSVDAIVAGGGVAPSIMFSTR